MAHKKQGNGQCRSVTFSCIAEFKPKLHFTSTSRGLVRQQLVQQTVHRLVDLLYLDLRFVVIRSLQLVAQHVVQQFHNK